MATRKIQLSLNGYHRWVVESLAAREGIGEPEMIRVLVRDWVRDHSDQLGKEGLSQDNWNQSTGRNVVPLRKRTRSGH